MFYIDHHDPASRFPAGQRHLTIHAFPALAGIGPARLAKEALEMAPDDFRSAMSLTLIY